jgi:thioredoxin-related protein
MRETPMRSALFALFLAFVLTAPSSSSRAALDMKSAASPASGLELIVVEAEGCIYCGFFRRDVLPSYETSEQGKEAPVRFVDVNATEAAHISLASPIDVVPTFVVVQSNHELGRISGYMSREDFFHSVDYLLNSAH